MQTLVIDVGGTNVKFLVSGQSEARKVPSGPDLTPQLMVTEVLANLQDWRYDRVTIGFPTPIAHGKALREPVNLGPGWVDFNFEEAFSKPVKLVNDAALQAIGSYEGGKMLFLGLGTGLGSAMVVDQLVIPLELAHLPYRKKKTYEDYVGQRGMEWLGKDKWQKTVVDVVTLLKAAMVADYVVLGGGNSKKLEPWPEIARRGSNANAFLGGFRLWDEADWRLP